MTLQKCVDLIKQFSHTGDITVTSNDGNLTVFIIDCINAARKDIVMRLPKRWLRYTGTIAVSNAAGVNYKLPVDCLELIQLSFTLSGETQLRWLNKVSSEIDFYRYYNPISTATGIPEKYTEREIDASTLAKQIVISPYPDRSFTLNAFYYKKWATEILTVSNIASEIPEIPEQFHNAIWKGGLYYFLKSLDDPAQTVARSDFDLSMNQIDVAEDWDKDEDTCFRFGIQQIRTY